MSKDPAVLFYTSDFLSGTMTMTDEEVGQYIRLLCLQHQKGRLSEKDMLFVCKKKNDVFLKFLVDKNGNYYNKRLEEEAEKRSNYCKSRGYNKKGHTKTKNHMKIISKSYENHMENENEDENKDNNKIIKKKFTPPTIEEVDEFCKERDNGIDAEAFVAFYATNGWTQGKGKPIKNWKACVVTWEKRNGT